MSQKAKSFNLKIVKIRLHCYNLPMKIQGKEWTQEGRIIAALINRLGGKVELSIFEINNVEGLIMSNNDLGNIELEAEEITPKLKLPYVLINLKTENPTN